MANDLNLFYLIEGDQNPSYISVPYISNSQPMTVDALRRTIFKDECKDLAPSPKYLTLLKVRILVILPFLLSDRLFQCLLGQRGSKTL